MPLEPQGPDWGSTLHPHLDRASRALFKNLAAALIILLYTTCPNPTGERNEMMLHHDLSGHHQHPQRQMSSPVAGGFTSCNK